MKKLLLLSSTFSLVFMGLVFSSSPPASAKEVKDGINYWSLTEMADFKTAIDAEDEIVCADDYACREDLHFRRLDTGGQYWALEVFEMERFIVSSINPSTDTIKLYYQDEDKMLSRIYGYPMQIGVKDFYLLWVEEGLGDPFSQGGWLMYGQRYPYFLGDKETVEAATHILIDENQTTSGYGWFTPNEEREYSVAGGNLANNTTHAFYFSLLGTDNGRMDGIRDYSSCFEASLGYQDGMECKIMFGEDGMTTYLPTGSPREEVGSSNDTSPLTDPIIEPVADTNSLDQSPTSQTGTETATVSTETIASSNETTISNAEITTPNTGENGHEFSNPDYSSDNPSFPWWLGMILTLSLATLIWLFWPSTSKTPKSHKKGIDRAKKVR